MQGLKAEELEALNALSEKLKKGDWYDLLGIGGEFTDGELKRAYYDLSRRYHPDRFYRRDISGHEELVESVFAGINKAYNVLRNTTERRRYDETRAKEGISRPAPKPPPKAPESTPDATAKVVEMNVGRRRGESLEKPEAEKPAARTARTAPKPKRPVPPHVEKLRRQIAQRLAKARKYYQTAQEEMEAGQWVKAAASLYLACQYAPKNEEYKKLHAEVSVKASEARVTQFMAEAANAMTYNNVRQATYAYEKAIEYDPPEGAPWFHLAELLMKFEDDDRGALAHFRKAVEKEPENLKYRMALAEQYIKLDLKKNAKREFQYILEQDPKNAAAKEGLKKVRFS
jgi:cytochrome c-type biogenesis protein CcmH/NrfG